MSEPLRLFILAGEPSGDRIGASLVAGLGRDGPVELMGVGGPELIAEGLQSLYPMDDLAVMGFADVLKRLPLLLWRASQTVRAIERLRPDIVVLIDAQVFSETVAARLRKRGSTIPRVLYVAPAVWAWAPERAQKLKPLFDRVLAVLPFEPKVMADLGGPQTHYVGHPALSRQGFRATPPDIGPMLLLPGSRKGELRRHLPLFRDLAADLGRNPAVTGLVIPTLPSLVPLLARETADWPVPVRIVTGPERGRAWEKAVAALAVSGTVTLELALSGIPMVVTYLADRGQARRYRAAGRTQPIALPNILLGRELVPELRFLEVADQSALRRAVTGLLASGPARAEQVQGFAELRALMEKGAPEAPLEDAAKLVRQTAQRLLIGS